MAFLERQIRCAHWIKVEGPLGEEFLDADLVSDIEEHTDGSLVPLPSKLKGRCRNKEICSLRVVEAWGARLAPFGELDSAPWSVFSTQEEAERYLDYVEFLHGDTRLLGDG